MRAEDTNAVDVVISTYYMSVWIFASVLLKNSCISVVHVFDEKIIQQARKHNKTESCSDLWSRTQWQTHNSRPPQQAVMYTVARENKIITRLFLWYDSVGMIIFASPFSFSLKRIYYDDVCLLGSVTNKHVLLHLENKISGSGHLCSATVLHYNAVFFTHFTFIKRKMPLLRFGYCTWDAQHRES